MQAIGLVDGRLEAALEQDELDQLAHPGTIYRVLVLPCHYSSGPSL